MTKLQHIAWYLMTIASTYAANDKRESFLIFSVAAVVVFVASWLSTRKAGSSDL